MRMKYLYVRILLWISFGIGMAACSSPGNRAGQAASPSSPGFRLPEVPDLLTDPEERAAYLSLHYWDHFDFSDTTLLARPEISEQAYVNFIHLLPYSPRAQAAVDTLFRRAGGNASMLAYFRELGDKYLYEPNSPMRNEELYILHLRTLLDHPALPDAERVRPRQLLELALKNRPGEPATDFAFVGRDGRSRRLSSIRAEYLLLYFNDPDCLECQEVKERLVASEELTPWIRSGRLRLLSLCVEGRSAAWEAARFPAAWIDGYDAGQRLTREQLYDLKAMPTLYLLDVDKRVILKDASLPEVEALLRSLSACP